MDDIIQNTVPNPLVRKEVRRILTQSAAYRNLPEDLRRDLAHDMVKLANYITLGETGDNVPTAVAFAENANIGANLPENMPKRPEETAGERFKKSGAIAAQQGATTLKELVRDINFPQFVAGLIDGVFNAINEATIKQLTAYAELVKNVVKSVDQYMRDNVTQNQARDYLADRYPDYLEVDITGEQPNLKPKEGYDEENLPDFFSDLGLVQPVQSLDEDTVEQELVPAARRRMAMDRQQLLATMVLMGVNRLVVTNGSINASVLFKLDTTDKVTGKFEQKATQAGGQFRDTRPGFWAWLSGHNTYSRDFGTFKVETTQSEDSEAQVKLHSDLSGKVNINFKSDYFPLERIANVLQINQIQEKGLGKESAKETSPTNQPGQETAGKKP